MKRSHPASFLAVVFILLAGCRSGPPMQGPLRFAPVEPQAPLGLRMLESNGQPGLPQSPLGEEELFSLPTIQMESRFISFEPGLLEKLGTAPARPFQVLEGASKDEILRRVNSGDGLKILQSPNLKALSGQPCHALVVTQAAYIKDIEVRLDEKTGGTAFHPVLGVQNTGAVLGLKATAENDAIALESLEVRLVRLLGMRRCEARIHGGGVIADFFWEEPVILAAVPEKGLPAKLSMKSGEAAILRLRFRIEQGVANARGYAEGGKVRETYTPGPLEEGQAAALSREYALLIAAKIVKPEEPKKPDAPAPPDKPRQP